MGKLNASCGIFYLLSFLADIIMLSVRGDEWAVKSGVYSFSVAMIIINLFIKVVGLLLIILIYGELGQSTVSVLTMNTGYNAANTAEDDDLDEDLEGKNVNKFDTNSMKNSNYGTPKDQTGSYQGQTSI